MKTKRVLRYYCEFCKKSGCGKNAMEKHELHCTMNPTRICGVCKFLGIEQIPIATLKEALILPKIEAILDGEFTACSFNVDDPLKDLKELTDCPACTLATIRQSGYAFTYNYNYKEAMKKVFDDYNEVASIEGIY